MTVGRRFWADWAPVAGQQFQYACDHPGRRVEKVSGRRNWMTCTDAFTHRFLHDGWNLVAELNGPNPAVGRSTRIPTE